MLKEIPADAFVIRYYRWCWNVKKKEFEFCKMFWGLVFSPVALLKKGVVGFCLLIVLPFVYLWDIFSTVFKGRNDSLAKEVVWVPPKKKKKRRVHRLAPWIEDKWIAFIKWCSRRKTSRFIKGNADRIASIVVGFMLAIVAGVLLFNYGRAWATAPIITLIATCGFVVVVSLAVGIVFLFANTDVWHNFKGGAETFFKALYTGGKAVKNKTCPIIKVVD